MKAKVIRGVYIRGKAHAEGEIVELSGQEFSELKHTNYVVAAPTEAPKPAPTVTAESAATAQAQASGKK